MSRLDTLVTGASGFIGRHLVQYIGHKDRSVAAVSRSPDWIHKQWSIGEVTTLAWNVINKPPSLPQCRVWFHLAANTDVRFCNMYPDQAEAINARSLHDILQTAEASGCEAFILVSTLGVYGNPNYLPTDEAHPKQPIEVYAASKSKAEDILLDFKSEQIKRVIVRLFNTFGPGQKATMIIPTLIRQAVTSSIVEVHNLESTRDFVYVEDVVSGIYECEQKARDGDIINIGSGIETSVAGVVALLEVALSKKLSIHVQPRFSPYKQVARSQADITRAHSILGWAPQTSLLDGLRFTIDQMLFQKKENISLY